MISWAEAQIVAGNTLGQESSVINLAALSSDDDNSVRVSVLLEQLISEVVNFSISEHDIACARATMECIIRAREAPAIRKENCIEFLLGCCPQIARALAEQRRFFGGEKPGLYNELSAFNDLIIGAIKRRSDDLAQAATCLELMYNLGDFAIREVATIGVIEGVANHCRNNGIDLTPFIEELRPNSRRAYDALEVFWQTDQKGT